MALRMQMLAVLGLLIGLNAVFALALLWGFTVLVPTVVTAAFLGDPSVLSDLLRLPLSPIADLGVVVLFLSGQLYYGYNRVLAASATSSEGGTHEVDDIVRRLSMTVDVPTPSTRIVDDETPSCYTVGRFTDATIVVTTGLIGALDQDELEAVLAHEVAHVVNRDVTLMTVTTLVLELSTRAYHTVRLVPRAFGGMENLSRYERLALRWFLPLSVVVYIVVSPVLVIFPRVANWATRTLSHAREYAADEAAATITGEPLALATALGTLADATAEPATDLRRTQALCVVPTRPVTGPVARETPESDERVADREAAVADWIAGRTTGNPVSGTHPPVEQRIERLQSLIGAEATT
ncbi:M48 family metallopeptidase [Halovenus rubra]|uniref:M48 family metallopeptidase n=2 Tax=Halovenus rubra TaxID=869890 RepID=A0ACC7E4V7_9EURY|nr:M48 family metalloprotease [Halovenus rubra]